jgi:hypothetical protein
MSFPPTTASFPPTAFHPEPLLAVACPTCFGAIAVGTDQFGQAAECPLCGCGFRVPVSAIADTSHQPALAASAASPPRAEPQARPRKHRRELTPETPPPKPASQSAPQDRQPAPEDPFVEPQPQAAPVPGLQFQEPVRTVGSGDQMITLRRLTPEERAVRRARRNMIMMLTGVSILMAIVLVFGTKRPKRRE